MEDENLAFYSVFVVHEMNFKSSWKFLKSFCKLSKEKNKFYK